MKQAKLLVWPRQGYDTPVISLDERGNPLYRYLIVGMLVSDTPLERYNAPPETHYINEHVVEGYGFGELIGEALEVTPTRAPRGSRLGDAINVIHRLGDT